MTMLLGARKVWFADTAFPVGPLLAPIWVRFFVRRRAIVEILCGDVCGGLERIQGQKYFGGKLLRSQSEKRIR
jgi:hypothetical protein